MTKTIIVKKNVDNIFFKYVKTNNIQKMYHKDSRCNNVFIRICTKLKLPFFSFLFDSWKNELDFYENIIFFDDGFSNYLAKYTKKRNKNISVILWYWNPIDSNNIKFLHNKYIDRYYTYNLDDAVTYNLNYNTQFYSKNIELEYVDEMYYDIVFVGRGKNRNVELENLRSKLTEKKLNLMFNIINNEKNYVDYDAYLKLVSRSKAILDFNLPVVSGFTLRVMESIFFEKKLITNNINIQKCDFYNKNNIFIIGIDDINDINTFLEKPYVKIDRDIVEKYDFYEWLKRFEDEV